MEEEAYWNRVAEELKKKGQKRLPQILPHYRLVSAETRTTGDNIREAEGTFVRLAAKRLKRWWEFFSELYSHDPQHEPPVIGTPRNAFSDGELTIDEIAKAVGTLKNGEAPGVGNITAGQ
ncbi:hypothetical protein Y032_0015g2693 [Ancylostoma ceylanicum]|nr:hypothetical protein Y032_0015g2693 [Ancylostoma ceylanicum]